MACHKIIGRGCNRHDRTVCYACGEAACRACTLVVPRYYQARNKRLCFDCVSDNLRFHGTGLDNVDACVRVVREMADRGLYPPTELARGLAITLNGRKALALPVLHNGRWYLREAATLGAGTLAPGASAPLLGSAA